MYKRPTERGFTLIELLVVISIIGLMSSIVLASLSGARKKARDTQRLAAIREVVAAIESYASDHNGAYPTTPTTVSGACGTTAQCVDDITALVSENHIASLPHDPIYDGTANNYRYCADPRGARYIILVRTEVLHPSTWCRPPVSSSPNTSSCASWGTNYAPC